MNYKSNTQNNKSTTSNGQRYRENKKEVAKLS